MDAQPTAHHWQSVHGTGEVRRAGPDLVPRHPTHGLVHRYADRAARARLRRATLSGMRPRLAAICTRNGGVVTRRDAVASGYTERELKTLTGHSGDWVVVRRGCYAPRKLWDSLDDDGRYGLKVRAAFLVQTVPAVVSHTSAAVLLGLPMRPRWRELVHVTRPGVTGSRTENGVKHHLAGFGAADLAPDDPWRPRITSLARTGVDIAREHGFEDGVVAMDAALRAGATKEQMWQVLGRMTCWPHVTRAREAVRIADPGAESIGESLLRLMVWELEIGEPQTQYAVVDGSRVTYADLRVRRHLFEFDGRVKYVGRDRGGVASRPVEDVLWDEKKREDWMRRAAGGHGMSRVTWDEMFGTVRARTLHRLRSEFWQTEERFGREAG